MSGHCPERRRLLLYAASALALGGHRQFLWAAGAGGVLGIRVWPAEDYTRVTIESQQALTVSRQFFIDAPPRLAIDVSGLELDAALRELVGKVHSDDPYIIGMRAGQNDPQTLRFVIDLKQEVRPEVFTLQPVAAYQHRLVFDLYPVIPRDPLAEFIERGFSSDAVLAEGGAAGVLPDEALLEELIAQHSGPFRTAPSAPPAGATASGGPEPGAAATASASGKRPASSGRTARLIIVAIDPGHGGEDPGAIGPKGTREKDVVLRIARLLEQRINATTINGNPMRAFLTRDADFFVPLATRVEKARRVQADLFISVHADAFTKPSARGASVFALSQSGATSTMARWLASKENQADLVGGINIKSHDQYVQNALLDMSTAAQIKDSLKLGNSLLREVGGVGRLHKSSVEQAGFAVLKAPDIPSVLVETAFISNPEEEQKLRTSAYQKQLADAMMVGIRRYFAQNPPLARSRSL